MQDGDGIKAGYRCRNHNEVEQSKASLLRE